MRSRLLLPLLAGAAVALSACGGAGLAGGAAGGRLRVVAAESVWGSLARQLGGRRVTLQSIIVNPGIDPHSYTPTAADGIALARSQLAIVNGIGYDAWASRLLDANPAGTRVRLDVGRLLGLAEGENPHQWYSPASVRRVIDAIAADYARLDPRHRAYYARRRDALLTRGLAAYNRLIAAIRARSAGVPVGYSESIFAPLGQALGLRLLTPYRFAKAAAEGSEVSAADQQTVDAQAQQRRIEVWVYNRQNATPDVQRANQLARAAGIPVATITETLSPASASFEQWQVAELQGLARALAQARRR